MPLKQGDKCECGATLREGSYFAYWHGGRVTHPHAPILATAKG